MGDPTSPPAGEARDIADSKPASPPGRLWAIGVLVLSAAVSMSMNTVHAFEATSLPDPLALMYGIAPVALAAMQSHAVALRALRKEKVGAFRKGLTFGLVIGGLGLSFLGIYDLLRHAVPDPIEATPIHEPAVFFSIVLDLMALAALHELLRESPSLVTAVQAAQADVPPVQEPPPPAGPPVEPIQVHAQPITIPPAPHPAAVHLPALRPFVPLMSSTQRSIALNGGSNGSIAVLERAPEPEPETARDDTVEDRPRKARRSTEEECERARAMYRRSVEYGSPMTQTELGERFGYSRSWARDRIAEVDAEGQR